MLVIKRLIKNNRWLFHNFKSVLLYVRYVKSLAHQDVYNSLVRVKVTDTYQVGENGFHCWFGYYDKSPMNVSNRYIAYSKVPIKAKLRDLAYVCVFDISQKTSRVIGKTRTWNWQQGSMLQWVTENQLRYNDFDEQSKQYVTKIVDVVSGKVNTYNRACYAANLDHSIFLSLNFYRLDVYAKGYGYPFNVDSMDVEKDGVWETSLATNESKLILTLKEVVDYNKHCDKDCQHYINHVSYCPNNNLIIFIHRWQKPGTEFTSRLLIFNRVTGELDTLLDNRHVSHYCWKSFDELMIFATDFDGKKGYMLVNIKTKTTTLLEGLPKEDGHPSYSYEGNLILTDMYPNSHRDQYLFIFDDIKKELKILDKLFSPFRFFNDERCDFHPRWSIDGKHVMIDNTHCGRRTIKVYKL